VTKTNVFSLLCVAVRVFALWAAVQLVIGVPGLLAVAKQQGTPGLTGGLLGVFAVLFLVVGLLWLFADKIAGLALARRQGEVFESDLDATAWFGVGIGTIGAWHLVHALLGGYRIATRWVVASGMPGFEDPASTFGWDAAGCVLEAVIAIVLVLRGPGLAGMLQRLREAGVPPPRGDDTP
jgi:hypothetical protein